MSHQIQVAGPAEILSVIAYRLGFQPTDALVVVGIRETHQVGLIVRADLDALGPNLHRIVGLVMRDGAARIVVVAYTEDGGAELRKNTAP